MSESEYEAQPSGLNLNDILFILFRHKWKILLCAMAGIGGAAAVYFLFPSMYESQAKLLVRYVVDRSAVDAVDSGGKAPGLQGINSEVEILGSWDLAMQVAQAIGVNRLLPGDQGEATPAAAAHAILQKLDVGAVKETDIISVSYQNRDPELAVQVLQELVRRYFDKHLEVHRSAGAFEFVTRETEELRKQLAQTEEELKQLKAGAGVSSLEESASTVSAELAKSQEELDGAGAEYAAEKARIKEIEKSLVGIDSNQASSAIPQTSSGTVHEYQALFDRVARLQQTKGELLARYTADNRTVKIIQSQIEDVQQRQREMEKQYPGLVATVSATGSSVAARPDLVSERAHLAAVEAKIQSLKARQTSLRERASLLSNAGPRISELERKRAVEEQNYKYFEASLEKARIDETLDPTRMPNISVVQRPSPAVKATRDVKKVVLGLAVGGPVLGIALALLIELILDRTVKRRLELETRLRIPLLLSIPHFGRNGHLRLPFHHAGQVLEATSQESAGPNMAPWESGHFIRPFCEAIRDRLSLYFEHNRMNHKPKLVAVAACSEGAGASTVATGLAAAFSETCDGKVLLVDKHFESRRFYNLIAEFKTSDFEYVIFDMPSLGNTSPTSAMAGFMDKVLLVVEAGKSNRAAVKRAYAELVASKANVLAVLNKSRSYGPKWLQNEM